MPEFIDVGSDREVCVFGNGEYSLRQKLPNDDRAHLRYLNDGEIELLYAGFFAATRSERGTLKPVGAFWHTADGRIHFCEGVKCKDDMHDNGRPIRIAYAGEEAPQSAERNSPAK